jgi:hypothetical protein
MPALRSLVRHPDGSRLIGTPPAFNACPPRGYRAAVTGAKNGFMLMMLAGTLAAVASGCGGGSSAAQTRATSTTPPHRSRPAKRQPLSPYEARMQVLGKTVARELAIAGRAVGAPTAKRTTIEQVLLTAQTELRTAANDLAKIKPPARVEAQHRRLIKAVREFADELTGVIAGVKAGNGAPVYAQIPQLKGLKDMQRASDAITKAGYSIVAGQR